MDDRLHRVGLRGHPIEPRPPPRANCPECRAPILPPRRRDADPGLRWLMAVVEQRCTGCGWLHVRVDPDEG